ncbi:MAG: thiamine pyrophosphate-dependent enzyme [Caldilineaceae bacterium]
MLDAALCLEPKVILADYRLGVLSRQVSLLIRREVLEGRATFGVYGCGKELAQIAMAKVFQKGDFRSGYYRDQTLFFALDMLEPCQMFAQLFANTNPQCEPATGGRSMIGHFGTRLLDANDAWLPQTAMYNSTVDISPTGGQMPRLVGLAYASRYYREVAGLADMTNYSHHGNEIAFGSIGNGSCAGGVFWESLNVIGALQVPAVISIWDDEYGISVHNDVQHTKDDLAILLQGFSKKKETDRGFNLYQVRGWDYPALVETYKAAATAAREQYIPAIIHVIDMVQPQGHSTSGSHERYKTQERLAWETAHDPLIRLRSWIEARGYATPKQLNHIEAEAKAEAERACHTAWQAKIAPIQAEGATFANLLNCATLNPTDTTKVVRLKDELSRQLSDEPLLLRRSIQRLAHNALAVLHTEKNETYTHLLRWRKKMELRVRHMYGSHLYSSSETSPLRIESRKPLYAEGIETVAGHQILRDNFDAILERDPRVSIFGEDVGCLGGVNQGVAGLQAKYGDHRVADTGICEAAIIGRAIGMALRGLRPIAEIQYIDYILYALSTISDDLATTYWRSCGGQKAPVIIRTRGHRFEGIWHSGSPMAALINLLRGIHIVVPRNMTQAAGFYNTLLQGEDPALVIECLNAYRLHERRPTNPGNYTVLLGVPEILRPGSDITLVTYGACCSLAQEAAERLIHLNISVEIIDVQSLLPFDIHHMIVESLKKTNRILFLDEDMPGGATAYMMQQVLEVQKGYQWLDSAPCTLCAQPHRPAFGRDGDYFSKPNTEDITETVYAIMHEADPVAYPEIWT